MNEELAELFLLYIDEKIRDSINNNTHKGCYFDHSDEASKIRKQIMEMVKED
jgi:hypothetical protein